MIVVVVSILAGSNLVVDRVKADADTDQHRGDGQRIQKGRQKRGHQTEQQRQYYLGLNCSAVSG